MTLIDSDIGGPTRDYVGYGPDLPSVRWPGGAAVAVSLCVNYEEGSEYSLPAGDERNEGLAEIAYSMPETHRDLCAESVYEYGSRAGIWRLLRLFADCGVKTTFFAAAVAIERNPQVGARMRDGAHELCSHGWRWEEHWLLSREQEQERIRQAVEVFDRICGERPVGWYCRYGPSVNTRELLVKNGGFLYDSDAYNDDLPYFVEVDGSRHLVVPYTLVYNDGRYVLPQGFGGPGDFLDVCRRGLDELRREGHAGYPKMMSVGLHPRWSGQAGRASALREFIQYAQSCGDVWFATRREIAEWWIENHADF